MSTDNEEREDVTAATGAGKFITYTIVVRADEDDVWQAFRHGATDGICFLLGEDGVTQHALDIGADPSSWDTDVIEKCQELYEQGGQQAVIDYATERQGYDERIEWAHCSPCETETPHYDSTCLVCGHIRA